ncbi:ATP-binding protein [uncultured Megasphaera sp.]|uniref:ATP-binding protein n=2 Tax=Megasphaera TaxID=906 RepID=UPI0026701F42|nr:ATP-binding protein [uncultured Megasphaera sp.]
MIQREYYMKQIRPFINTDLIKVLTGIRRSGKSVMLQLIQEELLSQQVRPDQMISLNFEDLANLPLCQPMALYQWIADKAAAIKGKIYIFLDEIQEVTNWERVINSLRVAFDVDIYLTGSNAKLLSGELSTYLAGRYVQFVIYPFSYQEFILANQLDDTPQAFQKYLLFGGMPFLMNLHFQEGPSRQYLQDMYNSVILKDIVQRNNLRDVDLLERIIGYALSSIGHVFSASNITKYLKSEHRKVSNDTVLNYLNACTTAYLFYKIPRQDLLGKKLLSINEKYYVVDHGLREAVYGHNARDIDQILENIVCLELLRRGYTVTIGKTGNFEVDFIAEKGNRKCYVQATYLLASPETIEREFRVYKDIKDNYPKYVVSMDELDFSQDGIQHYNIRKFLRLPRDY